MPSTENVELISWEARVMVPFRDPSAWSKNSIFRRSKRGVVLTDDAKVARGGLAGRLRRKVLELQRAGVSPVEDRVWLRILVVKPNHRSDAINVLDSLADAVEMGIGINDRWFEVESLLWEVDPQNPRIEVAVGQDNAEPSAVCRTCGDVKPVRDFPRSKGDCLACSRSKKRAKRKPKHLSNRTILK